MRTDGIFATAIEIHMLTAIIAKRTMHALKQRLDSAEGGISGLQHLVLRALNCHQQTISELSHVLMLDPSTLVPAVDALERKGFAVRGRDPTDRRRNPLSLTERGVEFVAANPLLEEENPLVQSLYALDEEQWHQLLALLRELVRQMPEGEDILQRVSFWIEMHTEREPTIL